MINWNWPVKGVVGAFLIAFCFHLPAANAQAPARAGLLTCQVDGSVGRILGSSRQLSCTFDRVGDQPLEFYQGKIDRIGIDLGSTEYSDIAWGVFALSDPYSPGALEGTYAGVSGQVTVGVGLGGNVLVGGFDRSFALQPVSLETSSGFNLALGVAKLELFSTPGYEEHTGDDTMTQEPAADGEPTVVEGVTE